MPEEPHATERRAALHTSKSQATGRRGPDADYICGECRAVDWASLSSLAADGSLEEPLAIRSLDASFAELSTSPCKVCRTLSVMKPASLDGQKCLVQAFSADKALLTYSYQSAFLGGSSSQCIMLGVSTDGPQPVSYGRKPCLAVLGPARGSYDLEVRKLQPDQIDYGIFTSLFRFCEENHPICAQSGVLNDLAGLRVIEISTRAVVEAPARCRYVALSYVWGRATEDPGLHEDEDLRHPPPVIEDAISATSSLGYEYLWVDRYCIPQDDEAKHRMINQMDRVYSNAHLTIIAAGGDDAQTGLPGVSTFHRWPQDEVHIQDTTLLRFPRHGVDSLNPSKWASRGWTYQESYFARRRLIFTADQVLFLCNELYAAESVKQPLVQRAFSGSNYGFSHIIPDADARKRDRRRGLSVFNLLGQIQEYCRRDLSYDSDSLNALLGVLNHNASDSAKRTFPIIHLWGVPIQKVSTQLDVDPEMYLLWNHKSISRRRTGFPTWTWAGWAGRLDDYSHMKPTFDLRKRQGSQYGREGEVDALHDVHISVEDENHTVTTLRDYFDEALVKISRRQPYQHGPRRLLISCAAFPLRFRHFELSRDQYRTETKVSVGFEERMARPSSGGLMVLRICEGVFVGAVPYLDQQVSEQDCLLGLSLCRGWFGFHFLVVRRVGEDPLYERAGLVRIEFRPVREINVLPMLFLDGDDCVLDEVSLAREHLFADGFERRQICLV